MINIFRHSKNSDVEYGEQFSDDAQYEGDEEFEGEEEFSEKDRAQTADKVMGVCARVKDIDEALDAISVGWKTRRMTKVDLTILRLAYYEIKYDENVPVAAAINEAVELAKKYGTENSASFVNGILAKVAKDESE